jgi:tagatose 1,6-diphosphate aldolase
MEKIRLSPGKLRGLQQCSTPRAAFAILALDHRNNLRQLLSPQAPEALPDEAMVAFKQAVAAALAPVSSALLLDPQYGAAHCVVSGALPGAVGLLVSLDATGYSGEAAARQSRLLPGWSVAKARRMGASAVKLLVYYHPGVPTAGETEELVMQVAAECRAQDLLFFLEPLTYSPDPAQRKLSPVGRRQAVIETAARLTPLGGDVLKAEFPLDVAAQPNEQEWAQACAELSAASRVPWVLLSGSSEYESYLRQVTVACQAGASGVAAGRGVWREAPGLAGAERQAFLHGLARRRMARLYALCDALGRPWTDFYAPPALDSDWFQDVA